VRHRLLIEELHLGLYVPRRMSPAEAAAARRALDRRDLRADLLRSARAVLRRHRALAAVTVTLTR
jgi:hypothetical protein